MFDNIFNKNKYLQSSAEATPAPALSNEHSAPELSTDELQAWHGRIGAAASDDVVLLQLAHDAPTVPLKLAAIEALTHESVLKQAMHDFGKQDKRLYRAAKSRWEITSGTRVATDEANALIASARTWLAQESVPVNRVVELDHAWAALNSGLLDASLPLEFAALSEALGSKVRTQGEHAQTQTRWFSAVDSAMEKLRDVLPGVAQGEIPPAGSAPLAVNVLDLAQSVPDAADTRCSEKVDAANRLLALASSVTARATFLQALPAVADAAIEKTLIEQWREFPEIIDGELHTTLAHRFADWRNASAQERQAEHDTHSAQEREQRAQHNQQRLSAIQRDIEAAEAAQAGGHVADLARLLAAIDHALKRGAVNASLATRIESLHREHRRLQDWQRWSGEQGREKLAAEAQALAEAAAGKVAIKAHADAIDKLRERWKDLDKLGGASKQAVWLAFDGALKAAYVPIAAHLEKLKLARDENLAAREKIVTALREAAAKFFPAVPEGAAPAATADWRAMSHALDEQQLAWRKLGPVEHTVPRKMLKGDNAVTARYAAAVQALEAPLKAAYGDARAQREQLIAAAKELSAAAATARDTVDKVRKLQSQWQAVAKALPLPRRDENALWMAFKTATDAIFAAKDAARAASEAAFGATLKAREEIIERVAAVVRADSAAEIKLVLTEADKAWRAAPEVPKSHSPKLDTRYRAARDAASKRIGEIATNASQARYDALIAKMALCQARETLLAAEDSNDTLSEEQAADLEARWNAVAHLPDAWKAKLDARFAGLAAIAAPAATGGKSAGKNAAESLPELLLNLEVACNMDSPAEFTAARQQLKIRALKIAMEGRQATVTTPADIERWLIDAAAHAHPDASSSERLAKIIAVVRRRG